MKEEMTANEMADKCNRLQGEIILGFLADCATMLRQQAKEIEELRLRELTDEEINKLWAESHEDGIAMQQGFTTQQHYFAHLILKKASEK
jgi:tartrate dehydratase beta subunit/fumarate hydratase class I family protein